jgi:hypothetical protein
MSKSRMWIYRDGRLCSRNIAARAAVNQPIVAPLTAVTNLPDGGISRPPVCITSMI